MRRISGEVARSTPMLIFALLLLIPSPAYANPSLVADINGIAADASAEMKDITADYRSFAKQPHSAEELRVAYEEARADIEAVRSEAEAEITEAVTEDPSNPSVQSAATAARQQVDTTKNTQIAELQHIRDSAESAPTTTTSTSTTTTTAPSTTTTIAPTTTTTTPPPTAATTIATTTTTSSSTTSTTQPAVAAPSSESPTAPPEPPSEPEPVVEEAESPGLRAALEVAGAPDRLVLAALPPADEIAAEDLGWIFSIIRTRLPAPLATPILDLLTVLRAVAMAFVSGVRTIIWPVLAFTIAGFVMDRGRRRRQLIPA